MDTYKLLLPEFDHEMTLTRNFLSGVADEHFTYQPHPKAMRLDRLATLVANLPAWSVSMFEQDAYNFADSGDTWTKVAKDNKELLALFNQNATAAREAIIKTPDSEFSKTWSLLQGEKKLLELPRYLAWRSYFLNHLIHHRAQIGVYLRLLDLPVPASYGPSTDDPGGM